MLELTHPIETPLISIYDSNRNNYIYVKDETKQLSGAYKYRGVHNKISVLKNQGINEVITASTGNHGIAVSMLSNQMGIKCSVVVPIGTPQRKIRKIVENKAIIVQEDSLVSFEDCYSFAKKLSREKHIELIHSFDDKDIIDGHRSLFYECRNINFSVCYCPVGGGGLLAAASALPANCRIVGVELIGWNSLQLSLKEHKRIHVNGIADNSSYCEGMKVKQIGVCNFNVIKKMNVDIEIVELPDINNAIRELNDLGIIAEGAGAAALAAYNNSSIRNETVLCIVTGGNIDTSIHNRIVSGVKV